MLCSFLLVIGSYTTMGDFESVLRENPLSFPFTKGGFLNLTK
jgi:hypothetical protein